MSAPAAGFIAFASHFREYTLKKKGLLAERVGMSPRNFARSYKAKTGRTPAKAIEVFQLEAARRRLEETEKGVDRIARGCGFGDEERMRTTFRRHLAISPRDYRRRFSTRSTKAATNEPEKA
jgi:transcriptional regulator GlxA family with amidase domain